MSSVGVMASSVATAGPLVGIVDSVTQPHSNRSPTSTFTAAPLENDVVLMFASHSSNGVTVATVAGWVNPLGEGVDVESTAHQLWCSYHLVTAAEAAAVTKTYTATNAYGTFANGNTVGLLIRNVDTGNVVDSIASAFGGSVTPHVLPGLTGTNLATGSLVIGVVNKDAAGTYTTPTGWTHIITGTTVHPKLVMRRDALTTGGVNVPSTNVAPDAADEYASIIVAVSQKP